MNIHPYDEDAVVIFCTNRGKHDDEPMRVGEVSDDGGVWTFGGDKDGRQPSPRGPGSDIHPEPCPECGRNFRHSREYWQTIVATKRALGESSVDASWLPDKLPTQ